MSISLKQSLNSGVRLLLDGGIGTALQQAGCPKSSWSFLDELSLSHADLVLNVHRDFIAAGVDCISTNTFQSNALRCPTYIDVREINTKGVLLAKQATGETGVVVTPSPKPTYVHARTPTYLPKQNIKMQANYLCITPGTSESITKLERSSDANCASSFTRSYTPASTSTPENTDTDKEHASRVYVLGSVGPIYVGDIHVARKAYTPQIEALLEAGVDGLLIETITHTADAKIAITIALSIDNDVPIIASVCLHNGLLPGGETLEDAIFVLASLPVSALGVNCVGGKGVLNNAVLFIREKFPHIPVVAYPNAGMPSKEGVYSYTHREFLDTERELREMGVQLVGGCCGVTAGHLNALSKNQYSS
eukprot:CFRG4410T1